MVYTVDELAKKLGKNPETIRRWCRSGKVKCTKANDKVGYLIEYDSTEIEDAYTYKRQQLCNYINELGGEDLMRIGRILEAIRSDKM